MPRPREVQRLQPWSGWGGSFRGALPGAGPGWGPHRLHPILRLPLSGRDCSGGDHDWFYTPPPPGAEEGSSDLQDLHVGLSDLESAFLHFTFLLRIMRMPSRNNMVARVMPTVCTVS